MQDVERLVQNAVDAEDDDEDDDEGEAPVKSITRHGRKGGKGAGAVGLLVSLNHPYIAATLICTVDLHVDGCQGFFAAFIDCKKA